MSERLADQLTSAFLKQSRFLCTGLVLDLQDEGSTTAIAALRNADALKSIALARALNARYVVIAGRLHRRHGGAFTVIVPAGAPDPVRALCLAARAGYARLGEAGETNSMWHVIGDGIREAVVTALADVSAVEGVA
jgi:hypothetical protein